MIEDDLKHYGVKLNIPAFLKGCDQLTSAEVKESKTIASVRIHVERAIQRLETFWEFLYFTWVSKSNLDSLLFTMELYDPNNPIEQKWIEPTTLI